MSRKSKKAEEQRKIAQENKKQEELIKKILLATAGLQLLKSIIDLIATIIKYL